MAGAANVLTDDSLTSRLDRVLLKLEAVFALLSGLTVFGLMLLAVVSVAGRNFFQAPLPGYVDWIQQAMPLIAFMGIAFTQRNGGHIRMDMLVGKLTGRALFTVEFITCLVMLVFMVLMVWGTWAHFQRSFDFAMPLWSRDSTMDIGLPIWPAKLMAPVAFSVLCLRLVLQLWIYACAIVTGARDPAGVPLPVDVATQAQMEAGQLSEDESRG